jgi:hypothetical protein
MPTPTANEHADADATILHVLQSFHLPEAYRDGQALAGMGGHLSRCRTRFFSPLQRRFHVRLQCIKFRIAIRLWLGYHG